MELLKIQNLKVWYGEIEALHGIDLSIEKGKITAIIGSNGAGKTTIINAISGMVHRKGTLLFEGKKLPEKSNQIVKEGIIQVPEGRKIFAGLTVEENLRLGGYTTKGGKQMQALIEQQYALFPRLGERRKQDAGTLSGGEQQMLAICRGLMAKPKLLMLDEPSLGLAPLIVSNVFKQIQAIKEQGITVILVEQNAKKSLSIADYAYVIENGNLVMQGPGQEILHNEQVAKAYLGSSHEE